VSQSQERLRVEIAGAVQGVGFRPFVYRLARELKLTGWVANDTRGVTIELDGTRALLEHFLNRLPREKPSPAQLDSVVSRWMPLAGFERFFIETSDSEGARSVQVLPDLATCPSCLEEILDPSDRRHGYPFTNCTYCGPRWSIVGSLPYDRLRTTMQRFVMCDACRQEYEDPLDRRFHAQPNACPECGPRLALCSRQGRVLTTGSVALGLAAQRLLEGAIVAVKGLGGFHLMAGADDGPAIVRLRSGKPRREKPFALMARDLKQVSELCELDERAADLLSSVEAPIVLLPRRRDAPLADEVAPGNPYLGVMLPYTPLHHLLLRETGFPVVATSGNLSDEPICIDEHDAFDRLGGIADLFLVHDRPIERHLDDSVVRVQMGRPLMLRRARGYAPRPIIVREAMPTLLATGAHLKNSVALSIGCQVFISQHIGDMETAGAAATFERVVADLVRLYDAEPVAIAHDMHPDYYPTTWAQDVSGGGRGAASAPAAGEMNADGSPLDRLVGLPLVPVQHHHAHLASCLAENGASGPALGITWDGTGYGTDGTIWGGEFLLGTAASFRRVAHLRPFRLPGGDAAIREPRRSALALLWEIHGAAALDLVDLAPIASMDDAMRQPLARMMETGLNAPLTTSAGRLFDGVASLIGLRQTTTFEGQAAMMLEHVVDRAVREDYPLDLVETAGASEGGERLVLDWRPLVEGVIDDLARSIAPERIAARFHNALARAIVRVAEAIGTSVVALSGGCFQNPVLLASASLPLRDRGFTVLTHHVIPPNDGGISFGQIAVAAARGVGGPGE